jgi:hypothetical protein
MVRSEDHLRWRERLAREEAMNIVDAAAQGELEMQLASAAVCAAPQGLHRRPRGGRNAALAAYAIGARAKLWTKRRVDTASSRVPSTPVPMMKPTFALLQLREGNAQIIGHSIGFLLAVILRVDYPVLKRIRLVVSAT